MQKLCSIIPCYNEARTIGPIVKRLREKGLDVYVADDGSTDETSSLARAEGAIVIRNQSNLGKGAALREGFKEVLKGDYGEVLLIDGDDQHDVSDMNNLIDRMEETGAGLVIGNRMRDTSEMPIVRIVVNRFMSYILSKVSGQYVPDTQCGYRLIKSDVLKNTELESSNYEIESEMIVAVARAGYKIESTSIKTVYQNEKSRINPVIDTLRFMRLMIKIILKRERNKK